MGCQRVQGHSNTVDAAAPKTETGAHSPANPDSDPLCLADSPAWKPVWTGLHPVSDFPSWGRQHSEHYALVTLQTVPTASTCICLLSSFTARHGYSQARRGQNRPCGRALAHRRVTQLGSSPGTLSLVKDKSRLDYCTVCPLDPGCDSWSSSSHPEVCLQEGGSKASIVGRGEQDRLGPHGTCY